VSVTRKLLAGIKALFQPNGPTAPPQEVEVTPEPASTTAPDLPVVAEAAVAEAIPSVIEEAEIALQEAPILVEEKAVLVEETPIPAEEAPANIEPSVGVPGALTLRLESERGPRSTFEVTKTGATIGRGPESTIQLADLSVSRKHAKIAYKQGAFWLSDLGSMGGTWIDGTKLAAPRRVATGQIIDIGLCRLTVVSAGADEESPADGPSHAASGASR
jgi:hypothetical protein